MSDEKYPEAKLWEMIKDIRTAMLTTMDGDQLESRPMHAFVDEDKRQVLFLTRLDSGKTDEIGKRSPVNLGFADNDKQSYISVSGTAEVVHDPVLQKGLWNVYAEAWMPEGPEAPTSGVIRVTPEHATLWDQPNSRLVRLFEVAKANVTQSPPKGGTVEHVNL